MVEKKVAVIGGTGAQGAAVIKALVESGSYSVRALTRDTNSRRAQELLALGDGKKVELVQGDLMNEENILNLFSGVELAFVNIDTFTIGEKLELFWGIRIYELAVQSGIKHFVWGNLKSIYHLTGFNPKYRVGHFDSKTRVAQWIAGLPKNGTSWSLLTSCPYMDMLFEFFAPKQQTDGSFVFTSPIGEGVMPMIALEDLGYYARWIFDNPKESYGLDLQVSTEDVKWADLVKTCEKILGKPCVYNSVTMDDFFDNYVNVPKSTPLAPGDPDGIRWTTSFKAWLSTYRDCLVKKDYNVLYKIHPNHLTLEKWLKKNNYDGKPRSVLKRYEDAGTNPSNAKIEKKIEEKEKISGNPML